ncbi:MAG: hypothetical protein JNM67_05825 [Bacteroidetes bacterium]|nr:hypothetical protein [Bacteroidota bacterium]
MKVEDIREKLNNYILVADDEKTMAMYVLLKDNINATTEWWKDESLLKEMDVEYQNWKRGKTKGYTLDEADVKIEQLRRRQLVKAGPATLFPCGKFAQINF